MKPRIKGAQFFCFEVRLFKTSHRDITALALHGYFSGATLEPAYIQLEYFETLRSTGRGLGPWSTGPQSSVLQETCVAVFPARVGRQNDGSAERQTVGAVVAAKSRGEVWRGGRKMGGGGSCRGRGIGDRYRVLGIS